MRTMINASKKVFFVLLSGLFAAQVQAQVSPVISGQDDNRRVITTAVPSLNFAPDSRHSGMGDVGVATSPDSTSAHWNPGKLALIASFTGFSLSYSPRLVKVVPDMALNYLTGYNRIDEVSALGVELRYFNLGSLHLTDIYGDGFGDFSPRDI